MAKRRRVMGLPIGKRRASFPLARVARLGVLGVTAVAAVPEAQRRMRALGGGQELMDRAGHAVHAAGEIKDAVSPHSSTVGKAAGLVGVINDLRRRHDGKPKLAHLIEEHTDISAPRSVVYNQWTQLEMLPRITKGVDSVEQKSDEKTEWTSKIGPIKRRWQATVTEQVPDERIAWQSDSGPQHQGVVTFHSLDDQLTRVMLEMHYRPSGPLEVTANKLGIQRRRVRRDLRLFKHFLELRGAEPGGWRGTIGETSAPGRSTRPRSRSTASGRTSTHRTSVPKGPATKSPSKNSSGTSSGRSRGSPDGRSRVTGSTRDGRAKSTRTKATTR
jgi:uncharacterized membrane protein